MSKYKVISDRGDAAAPGGRVITLEHTEYVEREEFDRKGIAFAALRRKEFEQNAETKRLKALDEKFQREKDKYAVKAFIALVFAFLLAWGVDYWVMVQNAKNEPKTEQRIEITQPAPVEIAPLTEEPDFFNENIPLTYEQQRDLYEAANEFDVPYDLALAVVWQETKFRNVTGDGGNSTGYMQIQKKWHGERMAALGVSDLSDPEGNFRVGCSLLSDYIENCDGDIHMALMEYNMGWPRASKLWKQGITSSEYSRSVVAYMEGLA